MIERGYHVLDTPGPEVQVVLHQVDPERPRPYRRKSAPTFVVALADVGAPPDDLLRTGYPLLVRALANLAVMVSDDARRPRRTSSRSSRARTPSAPGDDDDSSPRVFERMEPLASSRLVIANEFRTDLPESCGRATTTTAQIRAPASASAPSTCCRRRSRSRRSCPPRDLRHVKLLYGIGGLSYGNVSALRRHRRVRRVGRRVLDERERRRQVGPARGRTRHPARHAATTPTRDAMLLSVPPDVKPRRVSVDAIEHWMIYREHPEVGAILHVHAWIEGTPATEINYPCGTVELAELGRRPRAPGARPGRAVVGQRNHGLTITGQSLDEIFARIDGKSSATSPWTDAFTTSAFPAASIRPALQG